VPVILFDIGDTLATPIFSPADDHLEDFAVYPDARDALERLRTRGLRMGILSNAGAEPPEMVNAALERSGIYGFFDPAIIIYARKDSPAPFRRAAARAGCTAEECVFVGENSLERLYAVEADFRVSPHPKLAYNVAQGDVLIYVLVRIPADQSEGNWQSLFRELPIVPLHVTGHRPRALYAIATLAAAEKLRELRFDVELLGRAGDPLTTDLYLVRDDRETSAGLMAEEGQSAQFFADRGEADLILSPSPEGLYIAVPAGRSIEEFHFPNAQHGHNEKLLPNMTLVDPFQATTATWAGSPTGVPMAESSLSCAELAGLSDITPEAIRRYLDRYTGNTPLDEATGSTISSRHIRSSGNGLAVQALVRDLKAIGGEDLSVRRYRFGHEGRSLDNVEAEFHGREPGGVVLVTAHLDSTAAFGAGPYNPTTDPAPGADDDGSGVAAVLVIAAAIAKIRRVKPLKRTVRFVLFNAEEHGLIGSKAYARDQAAQRTAIDAVFQMDMIGYRSSREGPPHPIEVHTGYPPSADVEARSRMLANMLAKLAPEISPNLTPVQIYPVPDGRGDPAAGRSDHASFQERGYAACVVSEDFFTGPQSDSPAPQPNPNYHKRTDTTVDYRYAADIARVVAAAALLAANA
jgi:bacterial leucyl aminopeptidase